MVQERLLEAAKEHGTPLYVYDRKAMLDGAEVFLNAELPFGHTPRYAVKANPHSGIVKIFDDAGLHFDASSTYEADDLIVRNNVESSKISLSAQSLKGPLRYLLQKDVRIVATSLHQLDILHENSYDTELGVRINPGIGSGHNNRTNVGGPASSFGIWHEYVPQVKEKAGGYRMKITRLHTHIGSGADPDTWERTIKLSLGIAEQLPDVTTLDIGGGYKVARMPDEKTTDMNMVFDIFSGAINDFAERTDRRLHIETEPGTMLVANAGTLLSRVEDVVDTGADGYTFIKLDTGMNDILRPTLYGAQHPIEALNDSETQQEYVVVGHNCESGDILTPAPGDPEAIRTEKLNEVSIGDILAMRGVGAYCAAMRAKDYNGFPNAGEVLI